MKQTWNIKGRFPESRASVSSPPAPPPPLSPFDLPFLLLSLQLSNSTRNTFWWRLIDLPWSLSYCPILSLKIDFNLVFTKSVKSTFRAFWFAPVTRNILGYSLFSARSQDGVLLGHIFGARNLSDKWSSRANKYQESD